ncbi:MAG: FAD-dependent oxidoreductase [Pseudomonadota bacterium]
MVENRYKTAFRLYPYERVSAQDHVECTPVVIVGGGPIGMALALDLGQKGIKTLVLDDHDGVGQGSRAICFAKRTLEIADRLGCGDPMVDKGVVWNLGRVYRGTDEVYNFNLLPEDGHKRPAFINLQQPYFERFLVEQIRTEQARGAPIEIRGNNRVEAIEQHADHVSLTINTPDGPYQAEADYLIACDGANSPIRTMMNLDFEGRVFEDNFLIADIKMRADFPIERRFWFDPPFNPGETALMHKQPDDIWRLDFQLGWDIDRQEELKEENIRARVRGMIGPDIPFELEWTSIYTFRCCSMERYVHNRVIFAGDSAHQVSPFGARGANGGMQDADNLGWKLAAVLNGDAPANLIDTYHTERKQAADENILNSSRSADFLTPRTPAHTLFRDAVLDLVEEYPFARTLLNSGRLSTPCTYDGSPLNGPDAPALPTRTRPGAVALDAPIPDGWLLDQIGGTFRVLAIGTDAPDTGLPTLDLAVTDAISQRYLGDAPQAIYLIRPDQHIAARWTQTDAAAIAAAHKTAMGG